MASRRTVCKKVALFLYFFVLCNFFCIEVSEAVSGGFYSDNGREQSVLYRPLARREKQELQHEILNLLGLQQRPKRSHHDTQNSAPKYLLDIFKAFERDPLLKSVDINNGSRRAVSDSDVIVSFVNRINKIHHKSHYLRHEKDRRFYFDVSEVPPGEEIMRAEFRIYRKKSEKKTLMKNVKYKLTLCSITEDTHERDEKNTLEPVDEIIISEHDNGWMIFNVSGPIRQWIAFPSKNFGLYFKIQTVGQTETVEYTPQEIRIVGPKGPEEKQPFMVAYFKTPTQLHVRKARAAKKRQHESYYDQNAWNPYSSQDKYSSRRSCQRWTLYIGFKDLGWQDWIIAPDGFGAFYCHGECSFPLNAHMNATNHAIVQTLVHLMDPAVVPKPCCAPTQLSAITVLYFDDQSNVILKKYKNMVVKSCGCH